MLKVISKILSFESSIMSSSNNSLLLSSVFTVGFIVGGVVARFVSLNNNKELPHRFLIGNDREKEIDDDDITVVSYEYYNNKSSCHSSSSSFSSLYLSFSSLSNFLTSPDPSTSLNFC